MKRAAVVGRGHHGQRHRPRLRAAWLGGGADRHRAGGAGEGHRDDPRQPRPPGEEGHAPAGRTAARCSGASRTGTTLDAAADAEIVVEAASENPAIKFAVFEQLDRVAAPDAILATNTSSISITEIAARTRRPEQVIGMHFMNPVPVMQLVEVIRGPRHQRRDHARGDGDAPRRWARRRSR